MSDDGFASIDDDLAERAYTKAEIDAARPTLNYAPRVGLNALIAELRDSAQTWAKDGNCRGEPVALFFADVGATYSPNAEVSAKAICATCKVRAECLAYALDNNVRDGLWGGLAPKERQALKRARRRGVA